MQRERKKAEPSIVPARTSNALSSIEINQIYTLNHVTLITSLSRDITRKHLKRFGPLPYFYLSKLPHQILLKKKLFDSQIVCFLKQLEKFFLDPLRRFPNVQSLSEINRSGPIILVPVYVTTRSKQRWRL